MQMNAWKVSVGMTEVTEAVTCDSEGRKALSSDNKVVEPCPSTNKTE